MTEFEGVAPDDELPPEDRYPKAVEDIQNMVDIQTSTGNWNVDPYMLGHANGLILALATLRGREPKFLSAPDRWLTDDPLYLIEGERRRQRNVEHWSKEHDDQHTKGEMAKAAACYAWVSTLSKALREVGECKRVDMPEYPEWSTFRVARRLWPWDWKWWKPKDAMHDLVRAGALIVAELERLQRLARRGQGAGVAGAEAQHG